MAPQGKEPNGVETNDEQSFFVHLRLYGSGQACFDQTRPDVAKEYCSENQGVRAQCLPGVAWSAVPEIRSNHPIFFAER